jgi:hypothetical protein
MKLFFRCLLGAAALSSVYADQFAYIRPEVAKRAEAILRKEAEVFLFCEPCHEMQGQIQKVQLVETADVNYEGNHEVRINSKGVDLAYLFVRRGNKWKNVAVMMGLNPVSVSAELPVSSPAKPQPGN